MDAIEAVPDRVAAQLIAPAAAATQPPLLALPPTTLHAAIASLAIGGAERIVLDWAAGAARHHRVRIIVLRAAAIEWSLPCAVEIVRLASRDRIAALEQEGTRIAATGNPSVLCHLLNAAERSALRRGGATPIPVVHNAREGWIEPADALRDAPRVLTVSRAAATELRHDRIRNVGVIRHLPRLPAANPTARARWRARWAIPAAGFVVGMVGGVKPQKAYPRALRVLAKLLERRDAWLVILGGPAGRDGLSAWNAILEQCRRLDLCERVRLPGFLPEAEAVLPAFDLLLNTSRYEGLSIATLEALAAGLPVVASRVGGQGEVSAPGLRLLTEDAPIQCWASAIDEMASRSVARPSWVGFPTTRLWTLLHLPEAGVQRKASLFVTANLNAGGAQRSLVNLALELARALDLEIAVCGNSSTAAFTEQLMRAGISVWRSGASRDAFDHAEVILRRAASAGFRTIVFWNVDAKVKLLIAKHLAHSAVRLIDVSPGAYAFEEMQATRDFQDCIAYCAQEYCARLHRLVLKYHGDAPHRPRVSVIPNGVRLIDVPARRTRKAPRRIVVSGRIAPSKFLLEIVAAMKQVWRTVPDAELHVLGAAEAPQRDYAEAFLLAAGDELHRRIFVHGPTIDAPRRLVEFDLALVIGHHQGCPNAVLEAMAAGLAVVANDSGGTRELVIDGRTGVLLRDRAADSICAGLLQLLGNPAYTERLARAGRMRVERHYPMRTMTRRYRRLLT